MSEQQTWMVQYTNVADGKRYDQAFDHKWQADHWIAYHLTEKFFTDMAARPVSDHNWVPNSEQVRRFMLGQLGTHGVVNPDGTASAVPVSAPCPHCGIHHTTTCFRVKSIEYFENGTVKRVELHRPGRYLDRGVAEG